MIKLLQRCNHLRGAVESAVARTLRIWCNDSFFSSPFLLSTIWFDKNFKRLRNGARPPYQQSHVFLWCCLNLIIFLLGRKRGKKYFSHFPRLAAWIQRCNASPQRLVRYACNKVIQRFRKLSRSITDEANIYSINIFSTWSIGLFPFQIEEAPFLSRQRYAVDRIRDITTDWINGPAICNEARPQ